MVTEGVLEKRQLTHLCFHSSNNMETLPPRIISSSSIEVAFFGYLQGRHTHSVVEAYYKKHKTSHPELSKLQFFVDQQVTSQTR